MRQRRARAALAALIILVLWGLITHPTSAGTGDEPHYTMIAYSLAFDHDLDLTNDYANPANRALGGQLDPGDHIRPGNDGRLRPVHDIGMPLLFAPYYAVAYGATAEIIEHVPESLLRRARLNFTVTLRHLLSLAMIAITAWLGVLMFDFFVALSGDVTRGFVWAALLVLSPPILSLSFLFFTEIVSAVLAWRVFVWLRSIPTSRAAALAAGAAVGFLLLVHVRNAGLIAGLLGVAVYRSRQWANGRSLLVWFFVGVLALVLVRTAVTYHFWGTWITTPHARLEGVIEWKDLLVESATRLSGWTFDQEHGLLAYAPIYLLVPAGWIALWRANRELCIELSAVVVAYVGVMTVPIVNVHGWRGGWSPAARFLVPAAPFLASMVFFAAARVSRFEPLVIALAILQVAINVVVWRRPSLLWNDGTGTSALLDYVDGSGRLSSLMPSIGTANNAQTVVAITAIVVVWMSITLWLRRANPPSS